MFTEKVINYALTAEKFYIWYTLRAIIFPSEFDPVSSLYTQANKYACIDIKLNCFDLENGRVKNQEMKCSKI